MPTKTYKALANITLSSAAASVTFGSIPSTYRDLVLVINGTATSTGEQYFYLYFNNDTGANYSRVEMGGNGSSAASFSASNLIPITLRQGIGNHICQVMDYSATDKHKTVLYRNNQSDSLVIAGAGRWASTSVITSLKIQTYSSYNLASGTTFALYGIVS